MKVAPILAAASLVLAQTSANAQAEDWGRVRGPNGSGIAKEGWLPESFDTERHLAWRTEIPGGYSSPILAGELVLLTASEGTDLFTIAIDRESGAERWRMPAPTPLEADPRGPNSPVSSTPASDGSNVYAFFENFGLVSYDIEGEERWRLPLGPFNTPYGMGASPILVNGRVVMACDQDGGSFLVAVDAESGKEVWRTERPGFTHGFASPVVWRPKEGSVEIVVSGSYEICGYDAEDGQQLWSFAGVAWQAKSQPVIADDLLVVHSSMVSPSEFGVAKVTSPWKEALEQFDVDASGSIEKTECASLGLDQIWFLYDMDGNDALDEEEWGYLVARGSSESGVFAIRLGGRGDVTDSHLVWQYDRSLPNIPSPLCSDGLVYLLKESGIFTALDAETGERVRAGRIEGAEEGYFASPVSTDGRLLLATSTGKLALVSAGPEWEVLSIFDLEEELWATPALSPEAVFVRTEEALYCFRDRPA